MKPVEILWNGTRGKIVSHGYMVPYLEAVKHTAAKDDGLIDVVLDDRYAITIENEDDLQMWIPFLANAMAVAAGFSSHGENSVPRNRFNTKCMVITNSETDSGKEDK